MLTDVGKFHDEYFKLDKIVKFQGMCVWYFVNCFNTFVSGRNWNIDIEICVFTILENTLLRKYMRL